MVTLRTIPSHFQVSETLRCDVSTHARDAFQCPLFFFWHLYIFVTACSYDGMGLPLETLLGSH